MNSKTTQSSALKVSPLRVFPRILIAYGFLVLSSSFNNFATADSTSSPFPTSGKISTLINDWDVVYNGDGFVSFDSQNGIVLQPFAASSVNETHSSLALSTLTQAHPPTDFRIKIRASTEEQLRIPAANTWEVFSIFFNYNEDNEVGRKTNYFKLTEEGVELGTLSNNGNQTFLATSKGETLSIGKVNTFVLTKKGNHIDISIDGNPILSFTGTPNGNQLFDVPGAIGLYAEDARVHVYSVEIFPL